MLLDEEVADACGVDLAKDQRLSDLAMVLSCKPTKDAVAAAKCIENKTVDDYVQQLQNEVPDSGSLYSTSTRFQRARNEFVASQFDTTTGGKSDSTAFMQSQVQS